MSYFDEKQKAESLKQLKVSDQRLQIVNGNRWVRFKSGFLSSKIERNIQLRHEFNLVSREIRPIQCNRGCSQA